MNEKKWTDDSIRWPEDTDQKDENDQDDEEEANCQFDIFKDSDPHESFVFHFESSEDSADIDVTLNGFKSESDEIWKSTGLTLWKASEYLCNYIVNHKNDKHLDLGLRNSESNGRRRILELGAGLGLVGILSHLISSPKSHVVLTDGDTDALIYLRENVELNKKEDGVISCKQLIWGRESSLEFLQEQSNEKFDILLASDIVYSPVIIEPLWETVQELLEPNGTFVMAYARRKVPVSIDEVLAGAAKAGFSYEKCKESDDEKGVYIYSFRWNN